jgi:hypothetical protein
MSGSITMTHHHHVEHSEHEHVNQYLEHPADLLPAVYIDPDNIENQHSHLNHADQQQKQATNNLGLPMMEQRRTSDSALLPNNNRQQNLKEEWQKEMERKTIHHQVY